MKIRDIFTRTIIALTALLAGFPLNANAESPNVSDKTRANLMLVVRESIGADKKDEFLKPTGKEKAKLPDGREIEIEMASWQFIGDVHIRIVFDGASAMSVATPADLANLNVNSVAEALSLAIANVKRVYGVPTSTLWTGGIFEVAGKFPDLDSSYFLDREFWQKLLKKYPDGIAVIVPKRGGLLYSPVSDIQAVDALKRGVVQLYSTSGTLRVSSAVFLFKEDKWSVLQSPMRH